jgi:hypothetical protein
MKNNHPWFALVTFCATTTLVVALGTAIFFVSATVAFAVAHTVAPLAEDSARISLEAVNDPADHNAPSARDERFTGLITDDHCGARHDMDSDKSPAECANACVRSGAKYALVDGDKTYTLEGNAEELSRASGRRVTLLGSLKGGTIQVRSIASNQ